MSVIRLYHFLPAEYALVDIKKRRIKVAEIDQLNDPFELSCAALDNKDLRKRLRDFKQVISGYHGLLCFCGDWTNPLLWSHYADKHRGMCLGFDVEEPARVIEVDYVSERVLIEFPFPVDDLRKIVDQLLNTKYIDWKYEKEMRIWVRFA